MAITTAERTNILKLVVAMFNAPAGSVYLGEITSVFEANGRNLSALAQTLSNTGAFKALNPNFQSPQEFAAKFLTPYGLQGNATAVDFIVSKFNAGVNKGQIDLDAATALNNYTGTDAGILAAQAIQNNKASVAEYYSVTKAIPQTDLALLQQAFAGVTASATSIAEANISIDGANNGAAKYNLTTGFDNLFGTAAADSFTSNVVQNALGQQVNTLGSGDTLNGGGGIDSLKATVTAGVFAGNTINNSSSPIQPTTTSIELVKFEAVNSAITGPNTNTAVYINAKDMVGLTSIGSSRSDASLVIQNLTTKDNLGGNTRSLSDISISMEYTGNSDSRWSESDQSVYFDQDYIVPNFQTNFTSPRVDIRLMNEDKYDIDYAAGLRGNQIKALEGVFIGKLVITVNDAVFDLGKLVDEQPGRVGDTRTDFIKTYPELVAALKDAVALLKAANPTNLALQSLQAVDGGTFLSDISPVSLTRREGTSVTFTIDGSTGGVANKIVVAAQDLVLTPLINTPIPNSNRFERAEATPARPSTQELPLKINLEKVGLAGDGGELLVGSMFKDGTNTYTDTYAGKGISKFEVTVSGASDKPSSLSGLTSTGNNLREVVVKTNAAQAGTFSSLTIGNTQTDRTYGGEGVVVDGGRGLVKFPVANGLQGSDVTAPTLDNQYALKDVQTFDASGLKGNLTLFAALTNEVVPKYMNLKDSPAAAAGDNVQFAYTGGSGNDYINLHLSAGNLAAAGTTTREDFVLNVNGGAGDDEIIARIGNGTSGTATTADNPAVTITVAAPTTQGAVGVAEVFTATFAGDENGANTTVTFDGVSVTLADTVAGAAPVTAAAIAADFVAKYNSVFNAGATTWNAVNNFNGTVTFTSKAVGARTDIVTSNFAVADPVAATTDNWYVNSKLNANLTVSGGLGDDTIRTIGAGDFKINGNEGNDTIYADNSGNKAVYVFNVADGDAAAAGNQYNINNLQSQDAAGVSGVNALLQVTFRGITKTADIAGSRDALANVAITDLSVNQAIKEAINKDFVLSKLLVAVDGPGNSLIVRSLIDGFDVRPADLTIAFGNTGPLSIAQVAAGTAVTLFAPSASTAVTDGYVTTNFAQTAGGNDPTIGVVGVTGVTAVTETATMTGAGGLIAGETYTVAGLTYTSTAVTTQAQLLTAFASLANGATTGAGTATGTYTGSLTGYSTNAVAGNVVTFTSSNAGNVANLTDFGTTPNAAAANVAAIAVTSQGTAGGNEVATMTGSAAPGDVLAPGAAYTVAGLTFTAASSGPNLTPAQVLAAFANLANGATTGAGTPLGTYSGSLTGYSTGAAVANVVTFTASTVGDKTDLTDSGAVSTGPQPGGSPAANIVVSDGVAGVTGVTAVAASAGVNELMGSNSSSAGDHIIVGGIGNDVIVLGTTSGSTLLAASNDTVRYEAGSFGNDTVVNFGVSNVIDTGVVGAPETATMTGVAGLAIGEVYTVAGLTYTNGGVAITQAQLLAAFASLANGATTGAGAGTGTYTGALTNYSTGAVVSNVVTFTGSSNGNQVDLTDSGTGAAAANIAVTSQGVATVVAINDADQFDFVLLGGDINAALTNFNSFVLDKSIVVAAGISNTASVAAAFTDSLTAATHVYVGYGADNIANVYSVTDAAGVGGVNAVLVGTINLADTPWASLTATNFV